MVPSADAMYRRVYQSDISSGVGSFEVISAFFACKTMEFKG